MGVRTVYPWVLLCIWISISASVQANATQSKVRCSQDLMEVDIPRSNPRSKIYLQQLRDYPDEACKPRLADEMATFKLSLLEKDMSRCGITRVVNQVTNQKVYYHRVIVEEPDDSSKHIFTVKCFFTYVQPSMTVSTNHTAVRRSVLPAGFQEPDFIEIREEISGNAPGPILGVGVRQGGTLISGELNVSPGTPLQMEIFLDNESAPIYGLLVTYMEVSDTKSQEETVIFNGCSLDTYLFDNFQTVDGDFLTAKFRAFKFPESSYVQFRGTVNVCLDKCQGIQCSNGQIGYGRKRRAIPVNNDKNKVFEVTMSTFIKVDFENNKDYLQAHSEFVRRGKNKRDETPAMTEEIKEQFKYKVSVTETSGSSEAKVFNVIMIFLCLLKFL